MFSCNCSNVCFECLENLSYTNSHALLSKPSTAAACSSSLVTDTDWCSCQGTDRTCHVTTWSNNASGIGSQKRTFEPLITETPHLMFTCDV